MLFKKFEPGTIPSSIFKLIKLPNFWGADHFFTRTTNWLENQAADNGEDETDQTDKGFHNGPSFQGSFGIHFKETTDQPESAVVDVWQGGGAGGDGDHNKA